MNQPHGVQFWLEILPLVWRGLIAPPLVGIICLYSWAGFCYAYFRFSRPETEQRLKSFLNTRFRHHQVYPGFPPKPFAVTRASLGRFGLLGWNLFGLPCIGLCIGHLKPHSLVAANALLSCAGWIFASSWYGQRCLRLLNLDSFGEQEATGIAASSSRKIGKPAHRQPSLASLVRQRVRFTSQRITQWAGTHFAEWSGQ